MADYLVTDTELTSIADALRSVTGSSDSISFPSGMTTAIRGCNKLYESTKVTITLSDFISTDFSKLCAVVDASLEFYRYGTFEIIYNVEDGGEISIGTPIAFHTKEERWMFTFIDKSGIWLLVIPSSNPSNYAVYVSHNPIAPQGFRLMDSKDFPFLSFVVQTIVDARVAD